MLERGRQMLEARMPLIVTVIALACVTGMTGWVMSYGWAPQTDGLKDAAKAVSGKPWGEVIVLREGLDPDLKTHPGWDWVLEFFHRRAGLDKDALLALNIFVLALFFLLPGILFLRRPEVALLLLLIFALLDITLIQRVFDARPLNFSAFVLMSILFLWERFESNPTSKRLLAFFIILIALRVWIRAVAYLLGLPLAAVAASALLNKRWKPFWMLAGCAVAGAAIGMLLTGEPVQFLRYHFQHFHYVLFRGNAPEFKVIELQPWRMPPAVGVFIVAVFLFHAARDKWPRKRFTHPAFFLFLIGWAGGFYIMRFWYEFGFPALFVWLCLDWQDYYARRTGEKSPWRLAAAAFLGVTLCLAAVFPHRERWRRNPVAESRALEVLRGQEPGWFPGEGGTVYATDMRVFYDFFYHFPHAPWRYILGYETGFMPPEDSLICAEIYQTRRLTAYQAWADKMKPEDRLVLYFDKATPARQALPGLDWRFIPPRYWIGRPGPDQAPSSAR